MDFQDLLTENQALPHVAWPQRLSGTLEVWTLPDMVTFMHIIWSVTFQVKVVSNMYYHFHKTETSVDNIVSSEHPFYFLSESTRLPFISYTLFNNDKCFWPWLVSNIGHYSWPFQNEQWTLYSFFLVIDLDEHSAHAMAWRISPHQYKWLPSLNFCPHFVYEERNKQRWVMVQRNFTSKKKWFRHIPWAKTKVSWVLKGQVWSFYDPSRRNLN